MKRLMLLEETIIRGYQSNFRIVRSTKEYQILTVKQSLSAGTDKDLYQLYTNSRHITVAVL